MFCFFIIVSNILNNILEKYTVFEGKKGLISCQIFPLKYMGKEERQNSQKGIKLSSSNKHFEVKKATTKCIYAMNNNNNNNIFPFLLRQLLLSKMQARNLKRYQKPLKEVCLLFSTLSQ